MNKKIILMVRRWGRCWEKGKGREKIYTKTYR